MGGVQIPSRRLLDAVYALHRLTVTNLLSTGRVEIEILAGVDHFVAPADLFGQESGGRLTTIERMRSEGDQLRPISQRQDRLSSHGP